MVTTLVARRTQFHQVHLVSRVSKDDPAFRDQLHTKSLKRKTTGAKHTARSKAREAGKAVGTVLGKAIGNAERIIDKTAGTAKGILS